MEDDDTYGLLADFCKKGGIKISQRWLPRHFHEEQEYIVDSMMEFRR